MKHLKKMHKRSEEGLEQHRQARQLWNQHAEMSIFSDKKKKKKTS